MICSFIWQLEQTLERAVLFTSETKLLVARHKFQNLTIVMPQTNIVNIMKYFSNELHSSLPFFRYLLFRKKKICTCCKIATLSLYTVWLQGYITLLQDISNPTDKHAALTGSRHTIETCLQN